MLKKFVAYFLFFGTASSALYGQGVLNNGAQIVFSGAAQMYIAGGASGGYKSQAGGIIAPSAAGIITMEGDWTNNSVNTGFFSDNGTVVFAGAAQSINGSNSTTFYNLSLQGSGTKTQNLNTSVGGVVTTNGILALNTRPFDLNSFTLTVTNSAAGAITSSGGYIISETNLASNPSVLRWNMGVSTGAHIYPFGTTGGVQIPFTFNKTNAGASDISVCTRPTAAADNLPWSTPVTVMYSPVVGGNGSIPVVIDRWWDIVATNATSGDATFSYRGVENTLTPPYNSGSLGAQNWNPTWTPPIGSNLAVAAGVGNVTAPGINILSNSPGSSPWVLSSILAPLPIELVNFSASCFGDENVIFNWSTASEKNALDFEIQNSANGIDFVKIASVKAKGNSVSLSSYSLQTQNKTNYGKYYRLKMTDLDLSYKYSEVEYLSEDCKTNSGTPVMYYNQQTGIVVSAISKNQDSYTLNIIDGAGKVIARNLLQVNVGCNNFVLTPELSAGIYLINLVYTDGQILSKKIVIAN